jgi:hypothetical protein
MTRAIETLISAWVAEQERERVRARLAAEQPASRRPEPEGDAAQAARPDRGGSD